MSVLTFLSGCFKVQGFDFYIIFLGTLFLIHCSINDLINCTLMNVLIWFSLRKCTITIFYSFKFVLISFQKNLNFRASFLKKIYFYLLIIFKGTCIVWIRVKNLWRFVAQDRPFKATWRQVQKHWNMISPQQK